MIIRINSVAGRDEGAVERVATEDGRRPLDTSRGMVSMGRSPTFPFPQWVADDAYRTVFFDEGQGRTLVFVHGMGGNVTHWEYVLPELARGRRVAGLDLIGFGASRKPNVDYTIERMSDHLLSFLADRGIRKATLVGHSMGGTVAVMTALRRPDIVEGLALVGAAGLAPFPAWMRWGSHLVLHDRLLYPLLRHGYDWILDNVFVDPPQTNECVRHFRKDTLEDVSGIVPHLRDFARVGASASRSIVHLDLSNRLHELEMPVLAVWGEEDRLVRLPGVRDALDRIPRLRRLFLPRTGHMAMIERPGETIAEIERFLGDPP